MSVYRAELEGRHLFRPAPDWPIPDALELPKLTITCARCGATAHVPVGGLPQARAQTELWTHGWRRNPDTGKDQCPACEEAGTA